MKNITFFILLVFALNISAQNLTQPQPESWAISSITDVQPITLQKPDLSNLIAEDKINDKDKSIPWRFGYDNYVNFGLTNSGKWSTLANGDRLWRVNFISPKALSMNLIFDEYNIPEGAKVYIYNDNHSEILNVFTHQHNNPEDILGTWLVSGESIWIEYFEPKKVSGAGRLNIGNIIHGYRTMAMNNPEQGIEKALNDSGACNVDVNCDISGTSVLADNIKNDVKKSVAMIVVGGNGSCTGALVNNTNNDGTPYFLTANHCLGGSVAGWAFRFNWASDTSVADCATFAPSVNNSFIQTASGSILRASNSESDMALVEITDTAFFAANPDVVWAGWNRSTTATPALNVGVHHPSGDIQKVCVDFQGATRVTTGFNNNPTAQMWQIADWDLGVTEPGSSGSPLFNQEGLIIGKLSGGSAACSGTNDNGGFDIYGRFGVSWDFSATNSQQLKFWLDPAGTNPTTLEQFPSTQVFDFDAAITTLNIPANLCEQSITPTLRITNAGNTTLTSTTITYQLDSGMENTINWTGSLTTDETEDIVLGAITVSGEGVHSFTASVSNPNGNVDENEPNDANATNFDIPVGYETSVIRVIITPDRYGIETTWNITSSDDTVVGNGGPYTTAATNGTQPDEITNVTLPTLNDCYTFTINDSYGDGICCVYGAGTFRLEDDNNTVLFNGSGDFDDASSHLFKAVDQLSLEDNMLEQNIRIYPNPFSTDFNVNINGSDLSYELINVVGQKIGNGILYNGLNTISMKNQATGLYFVKINNNETNESILKKIIKH
jgi:lysyl endopeptidase